MIFFSKMTIPSEKTFRLPRSFMYMLKRYRVFHWFVGLCVVYLFWWSIPHVIDTSSSIRISLSSEDLRGPKALLVEDLEDVYWLERMEDIVAQCKLVCASRKYDVITQKAIRWNAEAMTESFAYFCKDELALVNPRLLEGDGEVIACLESYGDVSRRVQRVAAVTLTGVDFHALDKGRQQWHSNDPIQSCLYYHTVDIIESKWHI